jgi:hypothetical protein
MAGQIPICREILDLGNKINGVFGIVLDPRDILRCPSITPGEGLQLLGCGGKRARHVAHWWIVIRLGSNEGR